MDWPVLVEGVADLPVPAMLLEDVLGLELLLLVGHNAGELEQQPAIDHRQPVYLTQNTSSDRIQLIFETINFERGPRLHCIVLAERTHFFRIYPDLADRFERA